MLLDNKIKWAYIEITEEKSNVVQLNAFYLFLILNVSFPTSDVFLFLFLISVKFHSE